MEDKNRERGRTKNSDRSGKRNGASGVVIFLAILAILLAIGGALLLRQVLSARYEAQITERELAELTVQRQSLEQQLNDLNARYEQLSSQYTEMEGMFNAERRRVNQLRAQLRGDAGGSSGDSGSTIAQYRQRIQELEEQLENYRLQIEALEAEKEALSGENAQMRSTLAETSSRNQELESKFQEMQEQLEKASILTITDLEGVALRERRRGDQETNKAKRTDKLRICFNLNQNLVAQPGNRDFYIRIVNPSNEVLSISPDNTLEFEGETIQYSIKRTINYQNTAQEVCVMWTQDEKYEKGYYNVVVFSEGKEVGYKLFQLE